MLKKIFLFLSILMSAIAVSWAQDTEVLTVDTTQAVTEGVDSPIIDYGAGRRYYEIADIKVLMKNSIYEDHVIIGFSGLSVGDRIEVPGAEITNAVKRFWKQGLFSDVKIMASKIEGNKVWLDIKLEARPRVSDIRYSGIKKGERKDLDEKIGVVRGSQITPNQMDRAESLVRKYFDEKGFNKAAIKLTQSPDLSKDNYVFLDIDVQKKNKTKVNTILIEGNQGVSTSTLEKAMKKTRHKSNPKSWVINFLRSTNYIPENYEEDKENIISKYNELGYRDASIDWDTIYTDSEKTSKVNLSLKLNEGKRYHLRNVQWVGNTEYQSSMLNTVLNMKGGDVYNQKKLVERLSRDDDAVMNYFYQNNGYIFSNADAVEVNVENDSIDLEIRIYEGEPATIRKVSIFGNDRLYEDVVRRELAIKPGALYSRDAIITSLREIMQMGHFDPENLNPEPKPDQEAGVVDISFPLTSKANDQIEFSAGWGQTGVIGRLSLKFSNFSIKNLFNPSSYKGILPQGEGQTLTVSGQTNGRFYHSGSLSFFDPWFGGKRPNSLSVGAYYSMQTGVHDSYYNSNSMYNSMYNSGHANSYVDNTAAYADDSKSFQIIGASVGYGKRLSFPDDWFQFQAELSYQFYKMKNWDYFMIRNGTANNLSLNLTLSRYSVDNPLYSRRGSEFSLGLEITPPYSLWDGKDYANMERAKDGSENTQKYKWVEYHKWKFKARNFIPLSDTKKTPVLMTRAEGGLVGYFDKNKKSPFGTFYVGGDGMSGYSSTYATETIPLRGYANGSLDYNASAYARFVLELRYPLILEPTSTIYLLTFLEGGNAWDELRKINPFDLKRSAGVGARIHLPMIGLMGIDWAYGFDKTGSESKQHGNEFHFVIGQEF